MSIRSLVFGKKRDSNDKAFLHDRAPIRGARCAEEYGFKETILGDHIFLEKGPNGPTLIFCPGLYGSIYNIAEVGSALSDNYRFIIPYLPMYEQPVADCTVPHLADYLHRFCIDLDIKNAVFIGSSMGGGAILHYALNKDNRIRAMILCGSSGLSTIPMQKGFFKRKDLSFIRQSTQDVFFDPAVVSDEMIKEIFDAIQHYEIVVRSIRFTRSTAKDHLHDKLSLINIPALLIWGKQDKITPPDIALRFENLLPDAELHYLDNCGHVPTHEHPQQMIILISQFLQRINF